MKKYNVVFLPSAMADLRVIFLWGVRAWGTQQAGIWLTEIRTVCRKQLLYLPTSCPIAPESKEVSLPLRHLVVDRYRVIFTSQEHTVHILYVRGAYTGADFFDLE